MKKVALVIASAILSLNPILASPVSAAPTPAVNEATANALADKFVATAKAAEAKALADGKKSQETLAVIVAALEADVEDAVANGYTSVDISAALIRGGNRPDISKLVAEAFGVVRQKLASLLDGPGATRPGGNGGFVPAAPSPVPGGIGYVSGS